MPYKNRTKQKEAQHQHFLEKREMYRARDRKRYADFRAIIQEAKNCPCMDCGGRFHFAAMDFDHRGDKIRPVSSLKDFSSEEKLREEIAKCDVVCSNCHRVRTYIKLMVLVV